MNPIVNKLKEFMLSEELIGFSPWEDGDGMAWGRILDVSEKRIRVQKIDSLGQEEDIQDYQFSDIPYFEDIPSYAKRLLLLKDFKPTLPEEVTPITEEKEIQEALFAATVTGEVVRLDYPSSERNYVTVKSVGAGWAEIVDYDDLMSTLATFYVKISTITGLTWRSASCESDAYLLNLIELNLNPD